MANTTRNGYEIRADLLGLAKDIAQFNYSVKLNEYEMSAKKDGDQVVTEFKFPTISAEDIIEQAKKYNDFVTNAVPQGNETAKILMENVKQFNDKIQESFNPAKITENVKQFQDNVKKYTESFYSNSKKD
jgi:gas vesicle protein